MHACIKCPFIGLVIMHRLSVDVSGSRTSLFEKAQSFPLRDKMNRPEYRIKVESRRMQDLKIKLFKLH